MVRPVIYLKKKKKHQTKAKLLFNDSGGANFIGAQYSSKGYSQVKDLNYSNKKMLNQWLLLNFFMKGKNSPFSY